MLNISKISKMLLVSGLVLAFSCVTLDCNIAYADACKTAKKKLEDAEKAYKKAFSDYEKKVNEKKAKMQEAQKTCAGELSACSAYINAQLEYDAAKKDKTNIKKAEGAVKTEKDNASKACETKVPQQDEQGSKESRKDRKNRDKAAEEKENAETAKQDAETAKQDAETAKQDAERERATADGTYNNALNYLNEAKSKMQKACSEDPTSDDCKKAQQEYVSANNEYENAAKAKKEADEKYKKAEAEKDKVDKEYEDAKNKQDEAKKRDEERAQKAVDEAQADVDKYCTVGGKNYNERKCKNAQKELNAAQADLTYDAMQKEENSKKEQKKQEEDAKKKEELEKIKSDPTEAANNYVSQADIDEKENEIKKYEAEKEKIDEEIKELEKEKNIACSKPKSKDCQEAAAKLNEAEAKRSQIEQKKAQLTEEIAYDKDKKAAADQAMKECEGQYTSECINADEKIKKKELDDANKAYDKALEEGTEALKRKQDAEKAYNEALSRQAIACSQGENSEACKEAEEATKNAKKALDQATKDLETAEQNVADLSAKKEEAQLNYDNAKKEADTIAEEEELMAEASAKRKRELEAEEICKAKGENSPDCLLARERIDDPDTQKEVAYGVKDYGAIEGFNYGATAQGDVFEIVTRRAAYIILQIKPIVYIFAGFGLIAFAWGAIFNKLSWRHFAYISIGLFMVANMGQLIEYFVVNKDGYYMGQWNSETPKKDDSSRLAGAYRDTYTIYGNYLVDPKELNNTVDADIDNKNTGPSAPDETIVEEELQKRGYCEGEKGASTWSNFKTCVGDIVGSVNKAANAVKTTIATAKHVKNRVEDTVKAVENIGRAIDQMGSGDFKDIVSGLNSIMNNVDDVNQNVQSGYNSVVTGYGSVNENIGGIGDTNDNQSKSITNNLRQGLSDISGTVDSVSDAGDIVNGFANNKNKSSSSSSTNSSKSGSDGASSSSSTNSSELRSDEASASMSADFSRVDPVPATPSQQDQVAQKNYEKNAEVVNSMYNDIKAKEKELENLEKETEKAQKSKDEACGKNADSQLCKTYTTQFETYKGKVSVAETNLSNAKIDYETVKIENNKLYEEKVTKELNETDKKLKKEIAWSEKNLNEKNIDLSNTQIEYENVREKAEASGNQDDIDEAKRLEKLVVNKKDDVAKTEQIHQEFVAKETVEKKKYFEKSVEDEKDEQDKQNTFTKNMKEVSANIVELETQLNNKRVEAEKIVNQIKSLEAVGNLTDDQKIESMELRKKYNDLKVEYNQIKTDLTGTKSKYNQYSNAYVNSEQNIKKYKDELKLYDSKN